MDQKKPSFEDIQRAFAVTNLEPEIPEAMLMAFAAGTASEVECEIIESMIEVDPSLGELIETIREELVAVKEPLPSPVTAQVEQKKANWLSTWFWLPNAVIAVGACVLLGIVYVDRSHLLQDLRTKDKQVAISVESERKKVEALQAQVEAAMHQLGSSESDKQHLVADLERAKSELARMKSMQANQSTTSGGVESLVAHAITSGISMPSWITSMNISRGASDLPATMNPQSTAVLLPVQLTWSGSGEGIYQVEIAENGVRIWTQAVSEMKSSPPDGLLKPGHIYQWRLALGVKRGNWTDFRVCSDAEAFRAKETAMDKHLGPLEKGVVFASLGLVTQAKAQFKALRSTHPALADRLIEQLEKAREQP